MNKKILNRAIKKINKLAKKYDGFINVGFDNWRGFRFIFDTKDGRKCDNDCKNCSFCNFLKKEKVGRDNFGLILVTKKDKLLFGPQKFLNCKTLEQYEDCFVNFILQDGLTEKEIRDELKLVKNFRIIFSVTNNNYKILEKQFRKSVLNKISEYVDKKNFLRKL